MRRAGTPRSRAPTSASWINAVEGFFATLTKRRLQRGVFKRIVDLYAAINRFLDEHNANPKPFAWTADPHAIIEKVRRGYQALDSLHSHVRCFKQQAAEFCGLLIKRFTMAADRVKQEARP